MSQKNMKQQNTLEIWHKIVADKAPAKLGCIIHSDAVFRSPFAHSPYEGAGALVFVLSSVMEIFDEFTYHRELISDDGRNAFLEFSAKVGDKALKGIDMLAFDENGMITELEVMIRPMNGLQALAQQMAPRMANMFGGPAGLQGHQNNK